MNSLTLVAVFLTFTLVAGHDDERIENLDEKLSNKIDWMSKTFDAKLKEELVYAKRDIILTLKRYDIPKLIRLDIESLITGDELGQLKNQIVMRETHAMRITNQQLKQKLDHVTRRLSHAEVELKIDRQLLKKQGKELMELRNEVSSGPKHFRNQRKCCKNSIRKYDRELNQLKSEVNISLERIEQEQRSDRQLLEKQDSELIQLLHEVNSSSENQRKCCEDSRKEYKLGVNQLRREVNISSDRIDILEQKTKRLIQDADRETRENFSLLVARYKASLFSIVNLMSSAITPHPIRTGAIRDVVYHRGADRVMWSNYSTSPTSSGIFSARLDGSGVQKISSRESRFMAIDSARSLLFCRISYTQIMSLDLNTGEETLFTPPLFTGIYLLAVHTGRRLLFVVDWSPNRIIQVNYNGEDGEVIVIGSAIWAPTVDEGNNILYFSDGHDIKRYSLQTSSVTSFLKRSGMVTKLVYFRHLLFIAVRGSNSEIYNLENNSTLTINTDFGGFPPAVCFIPKIGDHS